MHGGINLGALTYYTPCGSYIVAVSMMTRSSFFSPSVVMPQAVAFPLESNLHPYSPVVFASHASSSRSTAFQPDPAGLPRLFPAQLTAMNIAPYAAVNPDQYANGEHAEYI